MRSTRSLAAGVVLTLVAVVVPPSNAGMIIDSFEDVVEGAWPVTHTTGTQSTRVIVGGLTGVLGGWRDTSIGASAVDLPGVDQIDVNISPEYGLLDYASSVGSNGQLTLRYWGDPVARHLHADLSSEALIRIDFADFDLPGGTPMHVGVTLSEGLPPARASLDRWVTGPGAQSLEFPFAEFDDIEYVDLADLDNIIVAFMASRGTDFRVDQIVMVVPEPATLGLLAIGGLLVMRRRRRSDGAGTSHAPGEKAAEPVATRGLGLFALIACATVAQTNAALGQGRTGTTEFVLRSYGSARGRARDQR